MANRESRLTTRFEYVILSVLVRGLFISMKAVGYKQSLDIDAADSLLDIEVPKPQARGRDLLVQVKAISVNPVDAKVRRRSAPENGQYKILGYDAAGVVVETGSDCSLFSAGDEVYYAGSILRQGTNSEFHLVDERIVGKRPRSLNFAQSAALPLTGITAWELLFDRLGVKKAKGQSEESLLIVGGAGGVGSILIQLARKLTALTVIATASRPETQSWCRELGAHHVIDHNQPFAEEFKRIGAKDAAYIASLTATAEHYSGLVEILAPQGKFGVIDDPKTLDANLLKTKCASLHWEYMFARSTFETKDMSAQHLLLSELADLVDDGTIRTTANEVFGTINAANLKKAHALVESGKSQGKIVLEGF